MSGCCQNKERDRIVIGIDFGTSNCLISYVDDDGILKFIHQNKSKSNLIPSRICFGYNLCHFGNEVNEKNDNTVKSIKRIIGLTLPEVLDIESLLPFKIKYFSELDENQDVFIDCGNSISKSVNEIVLEMMKQLRMIIFDHFQIDNESRQRVEIHAVITVPAYFDEKARTIIKKSALLTGIIVMRLINEPTAAALAYSKNSNLASLFDNKSYLVYDLGGGTFDVSIIKKYKDNFFRVLGIGGDKFLGGDDIDVEIKKALVKKNLTGNLNDHDILNKAKEIKENFNSEGILSKDEFEKILMVVINKTLKIMNDVIESTSEKFDDLEIESVILVGGSTRLPTIKDILSKKFKILCDQNPDEIVAVGAGLHAYEIMNKNNSHKLLDVIGMSFGIEVSGDSVEVLIEKNSPVPISKTQVFTTQIDNQKQMRIAVCQGESKKFSENILLGKFSLTNLPDGPAHSLQVEVTFSIDVDGVLSITAKELKNQNAIFVNFNNSYLRSQVDDIQ